MLMGSKKIWHLICVMFFLHVSSIVQGKNGTYNSDSLDDFIRDYAYKKVLRPRSGFFHNISLPSNFSGMEVSLVRVRSRDIWLRGANYSSFHIPPLVLPSPYVVRIELFYQNLGNWSSYYYNVPNHTLVTHVVALLVYDATRNSSALDYSAFGDPIIVHFPQILLPQDKNKTLKCARFDRNGSVEITSLTVSGACATRRHGHFSMVVPLRASVVGRGGKWKWWAVGFGGFILIIVIGFLVYKLVKLKRIGEMERESERSEALDTMWIGRSRMPSATTIRTQPVLENEYVP